MRISDQALTHDRWVCELLPFPVKGGPHFRKVRARWPTPYPNQNSDTKDRSKKDKQCHSQNKDRGKI